MRLCTIMNGGKAVVGVKNDDGKIIDLSKQMPRGPKSVVEILAGGKKVQAEVAKACAKPKAGATVSAKSAKYLCPIPNPGKILCIGLNYRKHAEETGSPIPDHGGLTHLQTAEFLYETRLFPEREYTFKHALTHEVAYSSLLLERRRVLHARIVEVFEVSGGDRMTEQVERLSDSLVSSGVGDRALVALDVELEARGELACRPAVDNSKENSAEWIQMHHTRSSGVFECQVGSSALRIS